MKKDYFDYREFKDQLDKSFTKELSFFTDFYDRITHRIKSSKQININNLVQSDRELTKLKVRSKKLTESIVNHKEHTIVEKEKITRNALKNISRNHYDIFSAELNHINQPITDIEDLYQYLNESSVQYFNAYKYFISITIEDSDAYYDLIEKHNKKFDYVINKHFEALMQQFTLLDNKISEIDNTVKELIIKKDYKENLLETFLENEIKNLVNTYINLSVNKDISSNEIKAITEEKKEQYERYMTYLDSQEYRLVNNMIDDLDQAYDTYYDKALSKHRSDIKAERYAKKKLKQSISEKKKLLLSFRIDNVKSKYTVKENFELYNRLLEYDPFLAQLFADKSSRIINERIDFTRLYKMSKLQKNNLYYEAKYADLTHQILLLEKHFVHFVKKTIFEQDIDLTNILYDMKTLVLERKFSHISTNIIIEKEFNFLVYIDNLTSLYINKMIQKDSIERSYYNQLVLAINENIRKKETIDIERVNATSDIKLAIKQSEIETLHHRKLYENEKRFLLMQQNRVKTESDINYDFIITMLENQMRFANQQIALAENEFKLRLSASIENIDNEREYFYNLVNKEIKQKDEAVKLEFSRYHRDLFKIIEEIELAQNEKLKKRFREESRRIKKIYKDKILEIYHEFKNNKNIEFYVKKLDELDQYLDEVFISTVEIYEKTHQEMDLIYRYAEEKLEQVKEVVDPNNYPMDDFLLESLEKIKERFSYKMKYSQIALDEKTEKSIENYKKLYFNTKTDFSSKQIYDLLTEFESKIHLMNQEYISNSHLIYQDFLESQKAYDTKLNQTKLKLKNEQSLLSTQKHEEIKHKLQLSIQTDGAYQDTLKKNEQRYKKYLDGLYIKYLSKIDRYQNLYDQLQEKNLKLVDSYKMYKATYKSNKKIKNIIHDTVKEHEQLLKTAIKTVKKEVKTLHL